MSWQGVAGSLIELTRDFRIVWSVRSGWSDNRPASWWQTQVGCFTFRLQESPGGLSVEHNERIRTVQCHEATRTHLVELVHRTHATDEETMRVHVDTVLRRLCQE